MPGDGATSGGASDGGLPPVGTFLASARIRLGALLGRGGAGAVYRATHEKLRREVAVKVLLPPDASAQDWSGAVQRLQDEARAAAAGRDAGLVHLLDAGTDPAVGPYLVYELLPGGTLADRLASGGPMPWPEALATVGAPLLETLSNLHARGIVHRDVTSRNLLADGRGRYKLGDLGLAWFDGRTAKTVEGTCVGTPGYMAPERLLHPGDEPGPPCDVYGAAAVLVEAATGSLPFKGADPGSRLRAQLAEDVSPARLRGMGLALGAATVLARALARDPAARHPGAAPFLDALRRASGDAPPAAPTVPSAVPQASVAGFAPVPGRAGRPRALVAWALAGALLAVAAGLAALSAWRSGERATAEPGVERRLDELRERLMPVVREVGGAEGAGVPADLAAGAAELGRLVRRLGVAERAGLDRALPEAATGLAYLAQVARKREDWAAAFGAVAAAVELGAAFAPWPAFGLALSEALALAPKVEGWARLAARLERVAPRESDPERRATLGVVEAEARFCDWAARRMRNRAAEDPLATSGFIRPTLPVAAEDASLRRALELLAPVLMSPRAWPDATHVAELYAQVLTQSATPASRAAFDALARRLEAGGAAAGVDEATVLLWARDLADGDGADRRPGHDAAWGVPHLRRAVAVATTPSVRAFAQVFLARMLGRVDRTDEALALLASIRSEDLAPIDRWRVPETRFLTLRRARRYPAARTALAEAVALAPADRKDQLESERRRLLAETYFLPGPKPSPVASSPGSAPSTAP